MVNGKRITHYVPLCNKNDISLGQILQSVSGFRNIGIDQTAVIPRSFRSGTTVRSLYLNIIPLSGMISSVNIKDAAPIPPSYLSQPYETSVT